MKRLIMFPKYSSTKRLTDRYGRAKFSNVPIGATRMMPFDWDDSADKLRGFWDEAAYQRSLRKSQQLKKLRKKGDIDAGTT